MIDVSYSAGASSIFVFTSIALHHVSNMCGSTIQRVRIPIVRTSSTQSQFAGNQMCTLSLVIDEQDRSGATSKVGDACSSRLNPLDRKDAKGPRDFSPVADGMFGSGTSIAKHCDRVSQTLDWQ